MMSVCRLLMPTQVPNRNSDFYYMYDCMHARERPYVIAIIKFFNSIRFWPMLV